MKQLHELISSIFDLNCFLIMFKAYLIALFLSFPVYRYFTAQGWDLFHVKLLTGIFFSLFLFAYLIIFDKKLALIRQPLISLLNLLCRCKTLVYTVLFGLLLFLVVNLASIEHWILPPVLSLITVVFISVSLGLVLGILFSSNNLSRVLAAGGFHAVAMVIFVLFFVLSSICLYAEYGVGILFRVSFIILFTTSLGTHFGITIRTRRLITIERNVDDLHSYAPNQPATQYYKWIGDGRIFWALFHLILNKWIHKNQLSRLSEKDVYKIKARIFYRLSLYKRVLKLVAEAEHKSINSDVFTSLRGLAYLQSGNIREALKVFHNAYAKEATKHVNQRNPFFAFNLGYIYWAKSEIEDDLKEAIRYTEESLEINQSCAITHNNLAFFKLEIARLSYYTNRSEFNRLMNEASKLIHQAFKLAEKRYYTLVDTYAYLNMLRGQFRWPKERLLRTAPIDIDARIHLAIILMVEPGLYGKSECYIDRILFKLRKKKWHRNYKVAKQLKQVIAYARGNVAFDNHIIFSYHKQVLLEKACIPIVSITEVCQPRLDMHWVFSIKILDHIAKQFSRFLGLLKQPIQS